MIFGAGPIPFLASFGLGVGLGFFYMLLHFVTKKLKLNKIFRNILDFIFVVVSTFLYFLVCFFTLEGTFRLFTLIGLGLGFGISFALVRLCKNRFNKGSGKHKSNPQA